ncbi:MAG: AbrB/MazE/SpoVT family DNA-binding domain-containing protein [Elsteraceae bacterium]
MSLINFQRAAQITLPQESRYAAKLKEGDYLEVEVTASGAILLQPMRFLSRELSAEQKVEIVSVVDQESAAYAADRLR